MPHLTHFAWTLALVCLICAAPVPSQAAENLPDGVKSSQDPKDVPLTPQAALLRMKAPEGFRVTLFAGEPNVMQPIAFTFDDRGRLWVAECYSYANWQDEPRDRILILEDIDGDGQFDIRKIFADKLRNLSGLQWGFGGVWACCAPELLFLPDADGDDVPDGNPIVKLDGWTLQARHNIYNGLEWGPDGWLYGCHGILADSVVGKPGTPEAERMRINCGVWRYHPTQETIEAVAYGTTNPWGIDFDAYGQGFFINCVIGHLWHLIPGAHYQRMYGRDFNPHLYGLIGATSDHLHWGGGAWTDSRGGKGVHSEAGGGHAHSGVMIYQGNNWPAEYRGSVYTNNIHGNRVNRDRLVRRGSGYVGQHAPDFLFANDEWFRGVALKTGPDGGVYIADWTDLGECHDNDGVHRQSGRIYKVVYKKPSNVAGLNLAKASDEELVEFQLHENAWQARQAKRLLQERAAAGKNLSSAHAKLSQILAEQNDVTRRLRALWTLHVTDGLTAETLETLLDDREEHLRTWSVRLHCESSTPAAGGVPPAVLSKFAQMARDDKSPLVRLYLASGLQRLPLEQRWEIAAGLASHGEDADDANLPLMTWYGVEPAVGAEPARALKLLESAKIPTLRQYIAKRLAAASK